MHTCSACSHFPLWKSRRMLVQNLFYALWADGHCPGGWFQTGLLAVWWIDAVRGTGRAF